MIFLSIDVGILNLAFVKAYVDEKLWKIEKILECKRINICLLKHTKVQRSECKLEHSNDVYDRIQHFLQEYEEEFQDVDQVLIERQPLGGLVHVEQLLFGHFRKKVKLISPNAMHKFLGINGLDYEARKQFTTKLAEPYLKEFWVEDKMENDGGSGGGGGGNGGNGGGEITVLRTHDMADAFCILLYELHKQKKDTQLKQKKESNISLLLPQIKEIDTINHFLDQFKFNKE